ncbi:MAG: DUF1214 domain-containing protein [Candidatus Binatia bacterium]|nr:DUF1214 domain-containing protein [Candidatus Binatia bacterium]
MSEKNTEAERRLLSGDAWREFCDRLKSVGERILEDDFPNDPTLRAEGFRHLTRLTTYALQWYVDFHDPEFPTFHRYDDDTIKWGGPNTDNHYLRAKIDPRGTYRVRLDTTGLRNLILSTPEGEMQLEQYRVFQERSLQDLAIDDDGNLEIWLSSDEQPKNWVPLHPDVDHVLVRLYVTDWENDAVPPVSIDRLGFEGKAPGRLEPAVVNDRLEKAIHWVEQSVVFWNRFLAARRERSGDNALSPPSSVPGGAADILYGGGWYRLEDGEGLLIECDRPNARYWSFQLYSAPWFESLDVTNRICSLNGEQMQVDADGRFRLVVSATDPHIPNWLDTEGRPDGMVSYRWIWSDDAAVPQASVVRLEDLRRHLPAETPSFGGDERRSQIERRRAGVTRRFRR